MGKEIFTKDPEAYIAALAVELKKMPEFEIPTWMNFVKTGVSRQRPPTDVNFWYIRAASILRQLYVKGVVGVGRLRTRYGSRMDRGGRPDAFMKSSGKIIRVILQQAEKAGLVEKMSRLQHGRRLTVKGREFLDSIQVAEKKGLVFSEISIPHKEMRAQEDVQEDVQEELIDGENE